MTKEHVLAKSLTKLFRDEENNNQDYIRHEYLDPDSQLRRLKRAKTFAYVSRKFCRSCNGGWMQQSDAAVRQELRAFASNQPLLLSESQQASLALWATKTMLGFQSIELPENRFAPLSLYRELYETRKPLAGSQLWISANSHGHMGWFGSHSLVFGAPLAGQRGFGASLSFGYANFHLVQSGNSHWNLQLRGSLSDALVPIWPTVSEVAWPPARVLTVRDLTPIATEINQCSEFTPRSA